MKRSLLIVGLINAALLLTRLIYTSKDTEGMSWRLLDLGILCLILAPVNLFVGFIVRLAAGCNHSVKNFGNAFMLLSAVLLLCSFTFCSQL